MYGANRVEVWPHWLWRSCGVSEGWMFMHTKSRKEHFNSCGFHVELLGWILIIWEEKWHLYFASGDSSRLWGHSGWRRQAWWASLHTNKNGTQTSVWMQSLFQTPHNLCAAQTHKFLSSLNSSSCSNESGWGMIVRSGVIQPNVTLFFFFFCGSSLSSCTVFGLQSALCFQRRTQLLTTLCRSLWDLFWRQRDSCPKIACMMAQIYYVLVKILVPVHCLKCVVLVYWTFTH